MKVKVKVFGFGAGGVVEKKTHKTYLLLAIVVATSLLLLNVVTVSLVLVVVVVQASPSRLGMRYFWRDNNAPDAWSASVLRPGALSSAITSYLATIVRCPATA